MVPEPVIGPPANGVVVATEVTVPAPAGVAQVPSPRQKVVDDAAVPELRWLTARFPVTPVESGNPVTLVKVPDAGVPSTGAVMIGPVSVNPGGSDSPSR